MDRNLTARVFVAVALLVGFVAAGAPVAEAAPAAADPGAGVFSSLVRLMGAMLVVFALFFGGIWFVRNSQRFLSKRGVKTKLQIIEAKSLGQRQTIFVIGYEQQRMLIASSPAGVTMLAPLPPSEAEPQESAQAGPPPAFADVLRKVWSGK